MVSFWWKCGSTVDREKMGLRSLMLLLVSSRHFFFSHRERFKEVARGRWSTKPRGEETMENLDNHAPLSDLEINYCTLDFRFSIADKPAKLFYSQNRIQTVKYSISNTHTLHKYTYFLLNSRFIYYLTNNTLFTYYSY